LEQTAFYGDAEGNSAVAPSSSEAEETVNVLTYLSPLGLLGQIAVLEAALNLAKAALEVGEASGAGSWVGSDMDTNEN